MEGAAFGEGEKNDGNSLDVAWGSKDRGLG
jgi:hypothetical protein